MARAKKTYAFKEVYPGIFTCPLPMPDKKLGPVNVYLFPGPCTTLLDTGNVWGTKPLSQALAGLGFRFDDLDQIVLSHGHFDHYGAAYHITRLASKPIRVAAHREDRRVIETGREVPDAVILEFVTLMGVPYFYRYMLKVTSKVLQRMGSNCPVNQVLEDGDTLSLGHYQGRVISTPGHTRGSISIHLPGENILFSGDHLLEHISPNALVMLDPEQPLPRRLSQEEFFASVHKIEELQPRVVFPGHGLPIHDLAAVGQKYRNSFLRRQKRILGTVAGEELTVFDIVRKIFPRLNRLYLFLDIYLAVSEVYSHLQVLEKEQKIIKRLHRDRLLFRAV